MLADRQGLLKGDLNAIQRSVLTYLVIREKAVKEHKELEVFKERMIAAHPEYAKEIIEDFEKAVNGEFAEPISEEDPYANRRLDAYSLEAALEQMKELGIALED